MACAAGNIVAACVCDRQDLAVGVVAVLGNELAVFVIDTYNVPLQVLGEDIVFAAVIHTHNGAFVIIGVVYLGAKSVFGNNSAAVKGVFYRAGYMPLGIVKILICSNAVGVVAIARKSVVGVLEMGKLSAVPLDIYSITPFCRVTYSIIGYVCAIIIGKQVTPKASQHLVPQGTGRKSSPLL